MVSHLSSSAARRDIIFGLTGAALSAAIAAAIPLPAFAIPRQPIRATGKTAPSGPLRLVDDTLTPKEEAIHSFISSTNFYTVTEGSGPLIMDVFFDPNCIFCHQFWERLNRTPNWQRAFTVHWIPVAFLKPDSASKGAYILLNGPAALEANERGFDLQSEEGAGQQSDAQNGLKAVQMNTDAWQTGMNGLAAQFGSQHYGASTPTIVVGNVSMVVGSPYQSYLDYLAGLAAKMDPSIAQSATPAPASGGLTMPTPPTVRGSVAPSSQAVHLPPPPAVN